MKEFLLCALVLGSIYGIWKLIRFVSSRPDWQPSDDDQPFGM